MKPWQNDMYSTKFVEVDFYKESHQKLFRDIMDKMIAVSTEMKWIVDYTNFPTRLLEYPWAVNIAKLESGMILADMGCSLDPLVPTLSKMGYKVTGVDNFSSHDEKWDIHNGFRNGSLTGIKKIKEFKNNLIKLNISPNYLVGDMSRTKLLDKSLDRIFCISVLEHLSPLKVRLTLSEWYRILKQGGLVVLTVDYSINEKCNFDIGHVIEHSGFELDGNINYFSVNSNSKYIGIAMFVLKKKANYQIGKLRSFLTSLYGKTGKTIVV